MPLTNFKKFKTNACDTIKQYNAKSDVLHYQVAHWDSIGMPGVWLEQFFISSIMLTFQIYVITISTMIDACWAGG